MAGVHDGEHLQDEGRCALLSSGNLNPKPSGKGLSNTHKGLAVHPKPQESNPLCTAAAYHSSSATVNVVTCWSSRSTCTITEARQKRSVGYTCDSPPGLFGICWPQIFLGMIWHGMLSLHLQALLVGRTSFICTLQPRCFV